MVLEADKSFRPAIPMARQSRIGSNSESTADAEILIGSLARTFRAVLQMTNLATIFRVCNTEAAARASFSR
jgi:hypothetical protein